MVGTDTVPTPAFRSYFEIFNGHGEVDAQSLENILLLVGISLMPAQVEDALMSADIDGEPGGFALGPRRGRLCGQSETCLVARGSAQKGAEFGFMLCCHRLEMLKNF